MSDERLRVVAATGLVIGAVLGVAGTFATSTGLRGLAWGIDGTAIVQKGDQPTVVTPAVDQDLSQQSRHGGHAAATWAVSDRRQVRVRHAMHLAAYPPV